MLKENDIATAVPRETSSTALPDWMRFPMLAEVFDQSPSKAISHLTAKHQEYQSREATGTAADRVRARLISASYLRTCALIQELEMQIELNKKQSTGSAKR